MDTPLINGNSYSFAEVAIQMLNGPLYGVKSINYDETQDKPNNFGVGTRPVSRGKGAIEAEGSIELSQNDIEALRDVAPDGSLLKLPAFDIIVTFLNAQKVVTHVLKNVEFTTDGGGGAQGDTDMGKELSLTLSHVKYR